jgi:hypothetical protein
MRLTNDEMVEIYKIQQKYMDAGYQWNEHAFNDGSGEVIINFTNDKSPHAFSAHHNLLGDFGWGRFDRLTAWRKANSWFSKHVEQKIDSSMYNVIVYFDNAPFVLIRDVPGQILTEDLLDAYSLKYDIERSRLSANWLQGMVEFGSLGLSKKY